MQERERTQAGPSTANKVEEEISGNNGNILVRLAGIEPTTLGFGGQYSIH